MIIVELGHELIKEASVVSNARMDEVVAILWLYEKLEEECDDGDDSRADDGDAVVDVVP